MFFPTINFETEICIWDCIFVCSLIIINSLKCYTIYYLIWQIDCILKLCLYSTDRLHICSNWVRTETDKFRARIRSDPILFIVSNQFNRIEFFPFTCRCSMKSLVCTCQSFINSTIRLFHSVVAARTFYYCSFPFSIFFMFWIALLQSVDLRMKERK